MRWFTIPVGALISAAIEYTQLVTGRGYCQLDDFVTNTAGAAIGFFIYLILYAGVAGMEKKDKHCGTML